MDLKTNTSNGAQDMSKQKRARGRRTKAAVERLHTLAWAHAEVRRDPRSFALAGQWLDMVYGEAAVRDRRRRFLADGTAADGFISSAQIGVDDEAPPELVLQARLSSAVTDLLASPPDMTPMAAEDPLVAATSAVLVACLATDRDASGYCRGLTELASLPWLEDDCVGRAMIGPEEPEALAAWGLIDLVAAAKQATERARAMRAVPRRREEAEPAKGDGGRDELIEALILAESCGDYLDHAYAEATSVYAAHGPPRREHMPEWREMRRAREIAATAAEREAMRERGEDEPDVMFVCPHPWEHALEEFTSAYRGCVDALASAVGAVAAAGSRGLSTSPPLRDHFLLDLGVSLRKILGSLHPCELGERGLGLIRRGCGEFPAEARERRRAVTEARVTLQSVAPAAEAPGTGPRLKRGVLGYTAAQLLGAINRRVPFSESSLATLRRAAKLPPAEANGRGAQRMFNAAEILQLAESAVGGKHNFRKGAAVREALLALLV